MPNDRLAFLWQVDADNVDPHGAIVEPGTFHDRPGNQSKLVLLLCAHTRLGWRLIAVRKTPRFHLDDHECAFVRCNADNICLTHAHADVATDDAESVFAEPSGRDSFAASSCRVRVAESPELQRSIIPAG